MECAARNPQHTLGPENAELVSSEGLIVSADPEVFQLGLSDPKDANTWHLASVKLQPLVFPDAWIYLVEFAPDVNSGSHRRSRRGP